MTDFPRVEPLAGPVDLDGVLAIEDASFNNPTTRARDATCAPYPAAVRATVIVFRASSTCAS